MLTFPSPITGAAQTNLTTPTYTNSSMPAPTQNGKQVGVTTLGGTQTNVRTSSASDPFWLNWVVPASLKSQRLDTSGNLIGSQQYNTFRLLSAKGVYPIAGGASVPARFRFEADVPCGADVNDPSNIRAGLSAFIGVLWAQSAAIGDSLVTGI